MPNDGYYYCLNCHSEITPDYNEHCCFCGSAAVAVSGDYSPEEVETAFDLLNKQQQGLVVVLPCKVGDTVYEVITYKNKEKNRIDGYIRSCIVTSIHLSKRYSKKDAPYITLGADGHYLHGGYIKRVPLEAFGETVFCTREEAEQALKGAVDNA